jgi:hypothetical protein
MKKNDYPLFGSNFLLTSCITVLSLPKDHRLLRPPRRIRVLFAIQHNSDWFLKPNMI